MNEVNKRIVGEEEVLVECLAPGRKGIGKYKFTADPDYEYPIAYLPKDKAIKIINSEESDGTNNFRIAVLKPEPEPEPKAKEVEATPPPKPKADEAQKTAGRPRNKPKA